MVPTCLLVDADDPPRRYKAYCYTSMTRSSRAVALLTSADGIHWRFDAANPVLDPEDRGYPWQPAGPVSHVHDVAVFRSGTDYLAIYQYIRHPIRLDLELAISPDGVGFRAAFADHAVIPRGGPGTWDRGIMTASPPVEAGRRQLLYYGATDYGHESDEPLDPQRERALSFRCGVAELRIDGFAALRLDGDAHDGWLETVPFTASEDLVLAVNADCRGGRVLVQIVDALTNAPLPNMSFTNCQPVVLDGLALQPQWSDSSGVIPAQRPIRLQLQLTAHTKTPRVYALCFQRPG
ncbi:MAG: hypothetical protein HOH74_01730 [Gemmatimonadetes bacterium]|nr:hypothetical protein [Gemmatimonadota bacterium]